MDKHDDEFYSYLSDRKDELLNSEYFDADELRDPDDEEDNITPEMAVREERVEIAQRMRENGETVREIADDINMSHTWVVENTQPPAES